MQQLLQQQPRQQQQRKVVLATKQLVALPSAGSCGSRGLGRTWERRCAITSRRIYLLAALRMNQKYKYSIRTPTYSIYIDITLIYNIPPCDTTQNQIAD
jgi:hypothetical protein